MAPGSASGGSFADSGRAETDGGKTGGSSSARSWGKKGGLSGRNKSGRQSK